MDTLIPKDYRQVEAGFSTNQSAVSPSQLPKQIQDQPIALGKLNTRDLFMKEIYVSDGATAAQYDHFFTAHFPCEVIQAYETHRVLGTNGSAVTLDIEKLTTGQALDAGVSVLNSTFDLKGTINVPQRVKANTVETSRVMKPGDRLALKDAGTLTAVAGVQVTVLLRIRAITIDPTV